jgi:hypothetical protein
VKSAGEERCRLFGAWGTKRWCYPKFSWVSSRIFRRRLTWYAREVGLEDVRDIRGVLGPDWWFRLRDSLMRVVLPMKYYQVWDCCSQSYRWGCWLHRLVRSSNFVATGAGLAWGVAWASA